MTKLNEKLVSAHLEIVLILTQNQCAVIGSEIVLDTPNGTLGDMGHVEFYFGLVGDGVSVGAR
jgi:hypothetical protein